MLKIFNALPGLRCEFAPNSRGQVQRSGYPDLRVIDTASGRSNYLDPKLYEASSRRSGFRTFYFEPRVKTNKVLVDACHIVVGIAHNGARGERARFLSWELRLQRARGCSSKQSFTPATTTYIARRPCWRPARRRQRRAIEAGRNRIHNRP